MVELYQLTVQCNNEASQVTASSENVSGSYMQDFVNLLNRSA